MQDSELLSCHYNLTNMMHTTNWIRIKCYHVRIKCYQTFGMLQITSIFDQILVVVIMIVVVSISRQIEVLHIIESSMAALAYVSWICQAYPLARQDLHDLKTF